MILGINGIEIKYHEAKSAGELEFLVDEYSGSNVLYLDTETTGLDVYTSRLLLLQLMDSSKKKVNVVNMASLCPSETKHLARILQDKELVIQNAPFDLQFLSWNIPELDLENLKIFDTKVAESVLCAGVQEHLRSYTSLKNISKRRLGLDLDKETRVAFIGLNTLLWT
jgi:ribonuclease D